MQNERLTTKTQALDRNWYDEFRLFSNVIPWAEENLKVGERVIGSYMASFGGEPSIFKFDIRNRKDKGITAEFEVPGRTPTVCRVNPRQMLVQETASGEIVQKYVLFCIKQEDGSYRDEWRLWHRREHIYHLEMTHPAKNASVLLVQCKQLVRDMLDQQDYDLVNDVRKRVFLTNPHEDASPKMLDLLAMIRDKINEYLPQCPAYITKREIYERVVTLTCETIVKIGEGRPMNNAQSGFNPTGTRRPERPMVHPR